MSFDTDKSELKRKRSAPKPMRPMSQLHAAQVNVSRIVEQCFAFGKAARPAAQSGTHSRSFRHGLELVR